MKKVIQVSNLNKSFKIRTNKNLLTGMFNPKYQYVHAVSDVSFDVYEGEALAFLGPNGAGKTTTTKMLTGLIYPTLGTVKVLDYIPFDRKRDFLMQIGLVMGNKTGLNWDLTASQSFNFLKEIYRIDDKKFHSTIGYLTELLDVSKHLDKQIRKLSLGERMKMELIGSILHSPKVLFLDEPTIGLDITSKKNIRIFLKEIQRNSNITLVLTSHDMDDVERVCDRVVVINKGEKVYDDDIDKLVQDYNKQKFIKIFFEDAPKDFSEFPYAKVEKTEGDTVTFTVEKSDVSKLLAHSIDKYNVLDVDIVSVPLEEMIEDIFKRT